MKQWFWSYDNDGTRILKHDEGHSIHSFGSAFILFRDDGQIVETFDTLSEARRYPLVKSLEEKEM